MSVSLNEIKVVPSVRTVQPDVIDPHYNGQKSRNTHKIYSLNSHSLIYNALSCLPVLYGINVIDTHVIGKVAEMLAVN